MYKMTIKKRIALIVLSFLLMETPWLFAVENNQEKVLPTSPASGAGARTSSLTSAPSSGSAKAMTAQANPTQSQTAEGEKNIEVAEDYKIQVNDRLRIKIYPEDQYIKGGEIPVSSEGNITLSLIGKVLVTGKTFTEVERELVKIIDADYLVNPEVVVELVEYGAKKDALTVIALGQVRKPGPYIVPPDKKSITFLELISMAGGFSEIANIKRIKFIRRAEGRKEVKTLNAEAIIEGSEPDVELESGDVISVPESLF